MPTLVETAADWLGDRLKDSAGIGLVYVRGNQESDPLIGVLTKNDYEIVEVDGSVTLVTSYDLMMKAAELVLGGGTIKPRAGDVIRATLLGVPVEFELMPIGQRPAVESMDAVGSLLLMHSKKVA